MEDAPLRFAFYKCRSKKKKLNSKSKQGGTNTSLLPVNIKTNTKADKHRVEQPEYDNKQVGQIMSKEIKGREQTRVNQTC